MLYFDQTPADFAPRFEVVSCLVECKNEILLLKRRFGKPEGGTWAMPAGKVDDDISIVHAVLRELREETGISRTHDPEFVLTCGVRFADGYDFIFHKYRLAFRCTAADCHKLRGAQRILLDYTAASAQV